ncbi:hypothetical protein XO29_0035 [Bacillus phage phiS58]|uniref:Uncharacterized protein n=1 Tax=Bacillus phage phiS58 TaxID=1643327 RepID=A0A0S2MVQ0_9CAUD|nr:hypothetical protein XO29_0035 [Bacillus phage phiS58]
MPLLTFAVYHPQLGRLPRLRYHSAALNNLLGAFFISVRQNMTIL